MLPETLLRGKETCPRPFLWYRLSPASTGHLSGGTPPWLRAGPTDQMQAPPAGQQTPLGLTFHLQWEARLIISVPVTRSRGTLFLVI